jgi:hypothetical protein
VKEQLDKIQASGAVADAVKAFQKKLSGVIEGGEGAPGLGEANQNVYGLYTTVGQVDAAPTAVQSSAADALSKEIPAAVQRWKSLVTTDLPALNQQLKAAGLPEVNPEASASEEAEGMDQDEG